MLTPQELKQLYTKQNMKIVMDFFAKEHQIFKAEQLTLEFFKGEFAEIPRNEILELKDLLKPRKAGIKKKVEKKIEHNGVRVKIVDGVVIQLKEGEKVGS